MRREIGRRERLVIVNASLTIATIVHPRVRLLLAAEKAFGVTSVSKKFATSKTAAVSSDQQPSRSAPPPDAARNQVAATLKSPPPRSASSPAASAALIVAQSSLIRPDEPFTAALLPTERKKSVLQTLDESQVKPCTKCRLCETRTQTVFGEGNVDAKLMFIGEGPGENEDLSGRPFVGRAGQLLDKMIAAMGLRREDVYIANVVKCRPPQNRAPMPDETAACTPYLLTQIETIRPQVIVTLGLPATRYILQLDLSMGKMRGQFHQWRGIQVMPTYHPSYVLRSYTPQTRAAVWSDLQQVMQSLGLKSPRASADGSI